MTSQNFESHQTKRVTVDNLEAILYKTIPVLNHGFIRVIDYMGDDNATVQAARVSYGKGTKLVNQDKALIHYLMRHRHTTPFEMCELKLHIKLPIFVARQWVRHRTASINEYSARYSILSNEFYVPSRENIVTQSETNKQCRSDNQVPDEIADRVLFLIKDDANRCYSNYVEMMNSDEDGKVIDENTVGIARELARINLNLSYYTEWYWKINLHNLLHFLSLRADPHAQYEIRIYADKILEIVKKWVPCVYEAFEEHRLLGANFSKTGLDVIRRMVKGEKVNQENSGLGKREWSELMSKLDM